MSSSPSLPWEVIERVIGHSADSTEALYSFTLTCSDLRPRSTILLLGCVTGGLKNRDQLLALCAFLQAEPHLRPCVRSITIPADEFSPYPLLRILPNLSEIKLTKIRGARRGRSPMFLFPPPDIEPTNIHASVLKCCHQLGQHIQTLSLQDLFFSSLSTLSDLLLSLPRIVSLSCEDLRVGKNRVLHEEHITQRLKGRLHLRTLTVSICPSYCRQQLLHPHRSTLLDWEKQ